MYTLPVHLCLACRLQMVPPGYRAKQEDETPPWWRLWGGRGKGGADNDDDSSTGGGPRNAQLAAAGSTAARVAGGSAAVGGGRRSVDSSEGGEGAVLWAAQPASGRRGMPRPIPLLLQQSLSSKATQAQELAALRELQEQQPQSRFNAMRSPSRAHYSESGRKEADTPSWSAAAAAAAASPSPNHPASDARMSAAGGLSSPLPQRLLPSPPSQEDYPSRPSSGMAAQLPQSYGSGSPAAGNEPSDLVSSPSRRKPSIFARGSRRIVALDGRASFGGSMPAEHQSNGSTSPPGSTFGGASPSMRRQEGLGDTLHTGMQDHTDPGFSRISRGRPLPYSRAGGMHTGASNAEAQDRPRARTIGGNYDSWREASSSGMYGGAAAGVVAAVVGEGGEAGAERGGPDHGRPTSSHGLDAGDSGVLPALGSNLAAAATSAAAAAAAQQGVAGVSSAHGPARPWSPATGPTGSVHSYSGAGPWPAEPRSPFITGVHGIRAEAAAGAPVSAPASPGGRRLTESRSAWRRAVEAALLEAGGVGSTVQEVTPRPGSARVRPAPIQAGRLSHAGSGMTPMGSGDMGAGAGVGGSSLSRNVTGSGHYGAGSDSRGAAQRGAGVGSRVRFGEPEASAGAEPQLHHPGAAVGGARDSWAGQNPLFREDGSRSDSDRGEDADRGASASGMDVDGRGHTAGSSNIATARFRGMREGDGEEAGMLYGHDSRLVNVRQHSTSSSPNASRAGSAWRIAGNASLEGGPQVAEAEPGVVMGSAPLRPKSGRRPEPLNTTAASVSGGDRGGVWSPRAASSLAEATPMHDEGPGQPWPYQSGGWQSAERLSYAGPAIGSATGAASTAGFAGRRLAGGSIMRGSESGTATRKGSGPAALDVGHLPKDWGRADGATSGSLKTVAWASEVSTGINSKPLESIVHL